MLVGLTIVLHGNKKVRDQRALEVISRLISRPTLREQMHTYQNKTFKQQICVPAPADAADKSLQSCPTLCDPIDGSLPGSSVPGILQARTQEWVAIAFSRAPGVKLI